MKDDPGKIATESIIDPGGEGFAYGLLVLGLLIIFITWMVMHAKI